MTAAAAATTTTIMLMLMIIVMDCRWSESRGAFLSPPPVHGIEGKAAGAVGAGPPKTGRTEIADANADADVLMRIQSARLRCGDGWYL